MAVRVRKDRKTIVCAAKSKQLDGDFYIDDTLHYLLGIELCVMSVCGHDDNGADLWEFHVPIPLEMKIIKEEYIQFRTELDKQIEANNKQLKKEKVYCDKIEKLEKEISSLRKSNDELSEMVCP